MDGWMDSERKRKESRATNNTTKEYALDEHTHTHVQSKQETKKQRKNLNA